jgi:hypothetical protein
MYKNITINQLQELTEVNQAFLKFKMMGTMGSFRNQDSFNKKVSKYCNIKNMKKFLSERNIVIVTSEEIDSIWEKVKEVIICENQFQ